MSIKSVLEKLRAESTYAEEEYGYDCSEEYKKDVDEAHSAILAELERMLPEEKTFNIGDIGLSADSERTGYNQCLQDIKERLKE